MKSSVLAVWAAQGTVGKVFIYFPLYLSDLMICFDSELFPKNFMWQLNNDRKSLDLY